MHLNYILQRGPQSAESNLTTKKKTSKNVRVKIFKKLIMNDEPNQ